MFLKIAIHSLTSIKFVKIVRGQRLESGMFVKIARGQRLESGMFVKIARDQRLESGMFVKIVTGQRIEIGIEIGERTETDDIGIIQKEVAGIEKMMGVPGIVTTTGAMIMIVIERGITDTDHIPRHLIDPENLLDLALKARGQVVLTWHLLLLQLCLVPSKAMLGYLVPTTVDFLLNEELNQCSSN
ncbi:hypothetical protein QVD17_15139 [Tagetes erecta]|uniref:Uncharacterized protein n=1 Tax=Tagetes erecta TaxID=13708 RepID=A0AAD8NZE8_TARER|nr:hypothetical protein QVD17_15139 [Tagetes erecta]